MDGISESYGGGSECLLHPTTPTWFACLRGPPPYYQTTMKNHERQLRSLTLPPNMDEFVGTDACEGRVEDFTCQDLVSNDGWGRREISAVFACGHEAADGSSVV